MKLYINTQNKRLVQSSTSSRYASVPEFIQGDNEPIELHLLTPSNTDDVLFDDKVFDSEDTLKVAIARFDDSPNLLSYTDTYTPIEGGGAVITLPLNTNTIENSIDGRQYINAYLEVELSNGANIQTLLQTACIVRNDLIDNAPSITLNPLFQTFQTACETAQSGAEAAAAAAENSAEAAAQSAGDAEGSAQSAEQSASDAETAKGQAQTAAGNAEEYASQSLDNAANAANMAAAAENSAEAAADSAELAASLVVNATELGLSKSAEGSFEIFNADGAGGLMLARPLDRFPLSVCFCAKIQSQAVGDIYAGQDAIETAANAGFALYKDSASTSKLAIRLAANGGLYSATFDDSTLADGNLHSVCLILNGSGKVFIDGVEACETGAFPEGSDAIADAGAFYFGKSAGGRFELSKIRAFNFDISADGAAYSLAQYAAGEEPAPELSAAVVFGDRNYYSYFKTTAQCRYDVKSGNLHYYMPANNSATLATLAFEIYWPFPFKTGQKIRVSYDSITGDAVLRNSNYGYMSFQNADNRYALGDTFFPSLGKTVIENVKTATYEGVPVERLAIRAYVAPNAAEVQEIQINNFRVEVDGQVLNLADFASARQARDLSFSQNHAVLLGGANAGKSGNPAVMGGSHYWGAGVSTGAYMLADSEVLPAYSQVEILARASAAATLNIGDSAGSPTKYATAANVSTALSSVATFYMGAVPTKLFITPSVAGLALEYAIKITRI